MRYIYWRASYAMWRIVAAVLGKARSFADDRKMVSRTNAHYYAPLHVQQQRKTAALLWLENRNETGRPAESTTATHPHGPE